MNTDPATDTTLSEAEQELYERSKDDRAFIAGSEVRAVIGKLRAERERSRQWENRADTAEMANAALAERLRVAEAAREMAERIANDVAGERDRAEAALARVWEAVPCAASRCGKTRAAHDAKYGTPGWTGHAFVSPVWFEAALAEPTADVLGAHGVPAEDAAKIDAKLAAARAKVAETGEAAT